MRITIRQFQEVNKINEYKLDELEKSVLLVKTFTGYSEDKINKMTTASFNKLCRKIKVDFQTMSNVISNGKPKNIIRANGKWYFLNYNISKEPFNAGKYVEASTFCSDIIGNLHYIMATMATPMKLTWKGLIKSNKVVAHEDISNDFLEADFGIAYHSAVFFWVVLTNSIISSPSFLAKSKSEREKILAMVQSLKANLVGYIKPNWYLSLKEFV